MGHTQPAGMMMVQLGTESLSFGECLLSSTGQEAAACSVTHCTSCCCTYYAATECKLHVAHRWALYAAIRNC